MALQATLTTCHGDVIENTYVKVEGTSGSKGAYSGIGMAYAEKDGTALSYVPLNFTYDTESERTFEEQSYDALKESEMLSDVSDLL